MEQLHYLREVIDGSQPNAIEGIAERSRLEKALRTPSIEVTFRLAQAFQIAPERLLKEVRTEFESLKG